MPMRHVVGEVPQGGSPWPPIASYAFLSDCEVGALVAPSGNVEWLCLPRFDAPSIFGSILDRDAGAFRLAPVDTSVPAGRRYLPGTMVTETTWNTEHRLDRRLRRAADRARGITTRRRSRTHRRTPTDTDADHVLLRTVRCVNGRVDVRMECEPRPDYGLEAVDLALRRRGLLVGRRADRQRRIDASADHRPAARLRGRQRAGAHHDARGRHRVRRPRLERARGPRHATRRRPGGSTSPPPTGTSGCCGATSRTTRGGSTCSAARSRSRA